MGVAATVTLVGSASLTARFVNATAPVPVFAIVSVSADVAPAAIVAGAKALVSVRFAAVTVRFAVAADAFVAPCVVVSAFAAIVLVYVLAVFEVTDAENVHDAFAASVAPEIDRLAPPAVAVTVPDGQVVAEFGAAAMVTPVGSVSTSAIPLNGAAFAAVFVMVTVSVDVPPAAIFVGANALAIVGAGGAFNVIEPDAGDVLLRPPAMRPPVAIVFVTEPGAAVALEVTSTNCAHEPGVVGFAAAGTVIPVRPNADAPTVPVIVAPHKGSAVAEVGAVVLASASADGMVSVSVPAVSAALVLFEMISDSIAVEPIANDAVVNDLVIVIAGVG